jgi:hypothetical protein
MRAAAPVHLFTNVGLTAQLTFIDLCGTRGSGIWGWRNKFASMRASPTGPLEMTPISQK